MYYSVCVCVYFAFCLCRKEVTRLLLEFGGRRHEQTTNGEVYIMYTVCVCVCVCVCTCNHNCFLFSLLCVHLCICKQNSPLKLLFSI